MTTVYKLTDENMRTYGGCQWEIGVAKTSSGEGELCGPGWLHAYTDPLLAVFLNPLYAKFKKPRLFECEGDVGKTDHGLKIGCTRLTLVREIPVPVVTVEQRVRFAILCAMEVYHDPKWRVWALSRLSGEDRSARASASAAEAAVWVAARAAEWAASAAEAAAWAAAAWVADWVADWAAEWAAEAAKAAAWAAAAEEASLDLPLIARQAMD